jgi:hypothetical protein
MASSKVELARNGDLVIYKKTGMSVAEFRRDHLEPFVPVVIADATTEWPARQAFTWDFFREKYGERAVEVQGNRIPIAHGIDPLARSNWHRFRHEARATLDGANPIKRAAAMACLAGLGGWMDVLERFGGML